MNNQNWRRIEELFNAAVELPEDERLAFVESEAGDDTQLLQSVVSLLHHHGEDQQIGAAVQAAALETVTAVDQLCGTRIGPWAVIREIGKGGMGTVYLAERADQQYDQKVAIKLITDAFINDEVLRRFLAERQLLARLEHPNIARLLDGGTTDQGIPYLVMEYIEGQAIDVFCHQNQLTIKQRLKLFQKICSAVQYAHQNLIVHRDLKPANILVGKDGEPRLLDFGIAKFLDDGETDGSEQLTKVGTRLFTLHYASPEQIRGQPVNTMSDVYSLGVILYELLTGRRPYRRSELDSYSLEKAVIETRVVRPSGVLKQSIDQFEILFETDSSNERLEWCGGLYPGQLKRLLSGDLDNILMMALRKDPTRRYPSVLALSEDINHYLQHEPVSARPATLAYRSSKFLSRHRYSSTLVLILMIAIIGFSITTWMQSRQIVIERDSARMAQGKAEAISDFLIEMFSTIDPRKAQGREITVREVLDDTSARLEETEHALSTSPEIEATIKRSIGTIYERLGLLQPAQTTLESVLAYHHGLPNPDQEELFETLIALEQVANQHFDQTSRLSYLLEAQQIGDRLWGPDHRNNLQVKGALASTYHMQGRLEEAHDMFFDLYQIQLQTLGSDHPETIAAVKNMAIIHHWLGNYEEARRYYRLCFDTATRVQGERSELSLKCMAYLGSLLETIGEYQAAEPLLKKHIELGSQVWGENHPEVLRSRHNHADTLRGLGRYDESEKLFLDNLSRRREHLGSDHVETLQTQFKLARLYRLMGRFDDAYPLVTEAVEKLSVQLGAEHPSAQSAIEELDTLNSVINTQKKPVD